MTDEIMLLVFSTGAICLLLGVWWGYTFTIVTEKCMERKIKRHGSK